MQDRQQNQRPPFQPRPPFRPGIHSSINSITKLPLAAAPWTPGGQMAPPQMPPNAGQRPIPAFRPQNPGTGPPISPSQGFRPAPMVPPAASINQDLQPPPASHFRAPSLSQGTRPMVAPHPSMFPNQAAAPPPIRPPAAVTPAPFSNPTHQPLQRPMGGPSSLGMPYGVTPPGHVQQFNTPRPPTFGPSSLSKQITPGQLPLPSAPSHLATWGGNAEVLDKFEELTLGPSAPGDQANVADAQSLPRPNGLIPDPPSDFIPGNAHHSFVRMTTGCAPRSGSLKDRFQFPFAAIIQPLAETPDTPEVPVVKLATYGIIRCRRCRTYINPFVKWVDGGRRWNCNVCRICNDTPRDYYSPTSEDGRRMDTDSRPELSLGSVEYVAPPEYMVRAPMPAVYLFVVDVSSPEMSPDVITTLSAAIKASLDDIQGDDRKRVGFLTFDKTLQFYNLRSSDSIRMMVVPDIDDPFLPEPDDLLVNIEEGREKIEGFLDSWASNFAAGNKIPQQSAMGAALQAAFMILSQTGGKLELFLTSPPALSVGAVKNRDNPSIYNTDREPQLRNPEDSFYKRFAAECSRVHICIDVFSFCQHYTDLASIVCLSRYTGGQVYRYPGYMAKRDGGRLTHDITRNLTRYTGWEGVMRLRVSKGLSISCFLGHFFIRSVDLLALPTCDPDKGFAFEIKHEETVLDGNEACIQCALLYTASCGERRIRVHTLQFPVSHEIGDLFKEADSVALTSFLAKMAVDSTFGNKLLSVQKIVEGRLISGLREYRILHSRNFRGPNKLIYPASLQYLPLWILCLLKNNLLRGNGADIPTDERMAAGFALMSSTSEKILHMLCPTLYAVTDIANLPKTEQVPPVVPCCYDYLQTDSVYLLDTTQFLFLLVGSKVQPNYLSQLTGVAVQALKSQSLHSLRIEPPQDNVLSRRMCQLIGDIRKRRKGYQPVIIVQLGTEQEQHLVSFLVEDKRHSLRSYMDFVLMLHRQIGGK